MRHSTSQLRRLWKHYECAESAMVRVPFGPDRIRVAPQTADAWHALAAVIARHGYAVRPADTDSYNCRAVTGGAGHSLHAFGIALDINWMTNPYLDHPGERAVRYSGRPTQAERALDVKHGHADTDMTPAMVADILAIKTVDGLQIFEWGGSWESVKDCMHFEIDLSPEELAKGIDRATVKGDLAAEAPAVPASGAHRILARSGLKLRAGPGAEFATLQTRPAGETVRVLGGEGVWALVDLAGDGLADGYMHRGYLREV